MTIAEQLYQAYQNNQPLDMADFTGVLKDETRAYQVQEKVMALKGEAIGGYKISLTSLETQQLFHSTEPLYGAQVASRILTAPATIALSQMNEPLIEVELAFTAKTDLITGMSDRALLNAVTVAGDMEIPDARFRSWFPKLDKYLVVADCAVGGYIVKGEAIDGSQFSVDELNAIAVSLTLNGTEVAAGQSCEVLDNPLHALQWLIQKLAAHGKHISRGQVISSGTFFVPPKLQAGEYVAQFSGALTELVELSVCA